MRNLEVWYTRLDVAAHRGATERERLPEEPEAAPEGNREGAYEGQHASPPKLCRAVDGELRIVGRPPLVTPIEDVLPGAEQQHLEDVVRRMIRTYRRSLAARSAQAARELSLRARGPEGRRRRKRRHARLDPPPRRTGRGRPAVPPVQGGTAVGAGALPRQERVHAARTTRRRGAADDAGGARHHARLVANPHDRRRGEGLLHPPALGREGVGRDRAHGLSGLQAYGRVCGWTLARAHARTGDRIAIAAYLGGGDAFDRAMASFAEAYADQNERDYAALQDAVASGRVVAQTGI